MTTIQILLGLLTIFGSGVVSAFVTYKLNTQRSEREFRRQKLEDCYDAIDSYCTRLSCNHLSYIKVAYGRITLDQASDINNAVLTDERKDDLRMVEKLTNIYFLSLKPSFEKLMSARDALSDANTLVKKKFLTNNLSSAESQIYEMAFSQLEGVEAEFKNEIFRLAQAIK